MGCVQSDAKALAMAAQSARCRLSLRAAVESLLSFVVVVVELPLAKRAMALSRGLASFRDS